MNDLSQIQSVLEKIGYKLKLEKIRKNETGDAVVKHAGGRPKKEIDVETLYRLKAEGKSNCEIAERLGVSEFTVRNRLKEPKPKVKKISERKPEALPVKEVQKPKKKAEPKLVEKPDYQAAVRKAYLKASGGKFYELVAISDIRKNMPQEMRSLLNDTLLEMQREKKVVLNVQGNPAALSREDRENPVMIAGTPRHVVYMEEFD